MLRDMTDSKRTDTHIQSQKNVSAALFLSHYSEVTHCFLSQSQICMLLLFPSTSGHHYNQANSRCLVSWKSTFYLKFTLLFRYCILTWWQITRSICRRIPSLQTRQEIELAPTPGHTQTRHWAGWSNGVCGSAAPRSCLYRALFTKRRVENAFICTAIWLNFEYR